MKYNENELASIQGGFIPLLVSCDKHICQEWHNGVNYLNLLSIPLSIPQIEGLIYEFGGKIKLTPPVNIMKWFAILSNGFFPVYTNIRPLNQMAQSDKVDMLHDIYGHVPYLINPKFNTVCKFFGDSWVSCDKKHHESLIKLWFYIIEFSVIYQKENLLAFGGGLITSNYFLNKFINGDIEVQESDICEILNSNISITGSPERLFSFGSVDDIFTLLTSGVEHVIKS
ncbi:hypothetical protein KGP17_15740 [Serratia sp. JSRIV001]|uniref:hypothetical protein n=1 Tax=unclassified Serratia (in: enterobacteria) TaxID=2647522 RepID=UPI001CC18F87|nr:MULTISPECIES: hypothetical protein [unclassified Serratia (in: enterobacteria)]UAN43932.1 hypothetical protein KGP17_15740 [Serratia sp. JSRIV001]UAN53556.1 hypothetical protein KGP26_11085 [Serratia sp. JSRIV002]UAN58177.1 hypothetical protein KGP21_03590 [Serratia sp. JSRIV004]